MSEFKSPVLEFGSVSYPVKKPTIGSLLKVEMMKSNLTGGAYGTIVSHGTVIANWNLDNVDMFAHLMVLCPELIKDIKAKSWEEMDIKDVQELKEEYNKKFIPWFEVQLSFLNPKKKGSGEKKKED